MVFVRRSFLTGLSAAIVLTNSSDPVGTGLAASLRRPGGNVTGITLLWEVYAAKHIELLREIRPQLSRIGMLLDSTYPASKRAEETARKAAGLITQPGAAMSVPMIVPP
jgi:putative tryptophan/tyrosine transport system substrate-binding protein